MSEFKDRNTQYPNRKKLIVKNINYEDNGDISELVVDVERQEGIVYEEGTEINATKFNSTVRSLANTCIEEFFEENRNEFDEHIRTLCDDRYNYLKDLEVVKKDKELLTISQTVSTGFSLPTTCENGSQVMWRSNNQSIIEIDENWAIVYQDLINTKATLIATLTYNRATIEKEFIVNVLPRSGTDIEITNFDASHIVMPSEVISDFDLETQGTLGSIIGWNSENNCIRIKADMAIVTRNIFDENDYLSAVVQYGNAFVTKGFQIKVRGLIGELTENLNCLWTHSVDSLNEKNYIVNIHPENEEITYLAEIETENDYLSITTQRENTSTLKFTINETEILNEVTINGILRINYTLKLFKVDVDTNGNQIKTFVGSTQGLVRYEKN